jgi:putative effector of murein hydrolase
MKKVICSLLAGALVSVSAPAFAEEALYQSRAAQVTPVMPVVSVRDAAKVTVAATLAQSTAHESSAASSFGPRSMPRGNDGVRKQMAGSGGGGGKTMMVVSLVTTVAGAAGGYLLYKEMKKDNKAAGQ